MAQALLHLGGGIGMQSQGLQGAGAPATGADPSASSGQANQQAALLQILTLAKLAAQLPAPQPQFFAPPAAATAAFAPPQQLGAPPPGAEASGTSSDRIALPLADATAELEAAPSVAGLKVRTLGCTCRPCPCAGDTWAMAESTAPCRFCPTCPPFPSNAAARDVQRHSWRGVPGPASGGELPGALLTHQLPLQLPTANHQPMPWTSTHYQLGLFPTSPHVAPRLPVSGVLLPAVRAARGGGARPPALLLHPL